MPEPPRTGDAVLDLVRKSELVDADVLTEFLQKAGPIPPVAAGFAKQLVTGGILTQFQAKAILAGKHRGFRLGPYRILDQIGAGGMGQVYLAEHAHMKRRVAVKVLPPRLALDKAMVERFYREARAVASLDHPNIVRAHDVACEKGTHFLVMEYIEGRSLAEQLAAAGGRMPVGEACGYVVQAAAGLKHAHDKGIAHRDVKPANLLVDKEGVVKILDMGLARFFEDRNDKLTRNLEPGGVMGTADYVAPEQLIDSSAADHRADIYSLGATLYHLVTGRTPFQGSTTAKLVAHQLKPVPPAHTVCDDVPEEVSEVIEEMMAKSPDDRYQSASEVVAALLPYVEVHTDHEGMPSGKIPLMAAAALGQATGNYTSISGLTAILPVPEEDEEPAAMPPQKKYALLGLVAAVVLLGVVLVAVGVTMLDDTPAPVAAPAKSDPDLDEVVNTPRNFPVPIPTPGKGAEVPGVLTQQFRLDVAKTGVEDAVFTPDDALLITAGGDKLVRVWDANTGKHIRQFEGHAQSVRALSLLPGAREVLSASHDKTVKLWDIKSGKCVRTFTASAAVVAVAALPDGRQFLSAAADGAIWLWDIDGKDARKKYPPAPLPVYGLAVSRDGRRAVAGTWDAKRNGAKVDDLAKLPPVAAWTFEIETGKELKRVPSDASISHISMSADRRQAVFGTNTGVTVFDVETGSFRPLSGVSKRVVGATFTRDGRHVVSTGHDNAITIWDVKAGKPIAAEAGFAGQGFNVGASSDGKRIAVVGANGLAEVWMLPAVVVPPPVGVAMPRETALLTSDSGTPEDLIFSADGTRVVGAFQGAKHLMVWDAVTGAEVGRLKLPDVVASGSRGLALLPGDRIVSCGPSDPAVRVWNVKTGELVQRLTADNVNGYTSLATTADGRVLAAATDKSVRMWNSGDEKEVARFGLGADVRGIAVTPDGSRFVVGCGDKTVRMWDTATKAEIRKVSADPVVWRAAVSPDQKWFGFGVSDGIVLWNVDTGEARPLRPGAKGGAKGAPKGVNIDGVAFARDGRHVFGGSADKGLHVWEFSNSRHVGKVTEHTGTIRSVVASPDGKRLATSSIDGTGVVWLLPESMWRGP